MKKVLTAAFILSLSTAVMADPESTGSTDSAYDPIQLQNLPQYIIFDDGTQINVRDLTVSDYSTDKEKTVPQFSGNDRISRQPEFGSSDVMVFEWLNFKIRNR